MQNNVDQIKSRLDIVDVIGGYIKLTKAGSNYKARCPFHSERTPSFIVSPVRQTYYCFGCNRGGDMFTFAEEMEGLDFRGALELLARLAGVELASFSGGESSGKSEKEELYRALEKACLWYQKNITLHKDALGYLYKRGLKPETLKTFRIGFAPEEWQALLEYLKKEGYADQTIKRAGLSAESERGSFDRFRGRIMFPVFDILGRVVGFSARIFGKEGGNMAKYVNSPETILYNKSRVLYGFDKAKEGIRKQKEALLVEGQMDLLMSHQAGLTNTVATSGTALSPEHAKQIARLADTLIIAFDADEAGIAAALRASRVALNAGLEVRAVFLDEGKDPADIILEDANVWKEKVEGAEHVITARLKKLKEESAGEKLAFRKKATREIMPLLAAISGAVDRDHFIQESAKLLEVSEESVKEEVDKAQQEEERAEFSETKKEESDPDEKERRGRKEVLFRHIAALLFWQESLKKPDIDAEVGWGELSEVWGSDAKNLADKIPEKEKQKLIFEAEAQSVEESKIKQTFQNTLKELEIILKKEKAAGILKEVHKKELAGDTEKADKLLKEYQKLSQEIHEDY